MWSSRLFRSWVRRTIVWRCLERGYLAISSAWKWSKISHLELSIKLPCVSRRQQTMSYASFLAKTKLYSTLRNLQSCRGSIARTCSFAWQRLRAKTINSRRPTSPSTQSLKLITSNRSSLQRKIPDEDLIKLSNLYILKDVLLLRESYA